MENTKNKIRELRISKNLTQQQLADELHVTKQAISKWEKGKSIPDITSIELIASYFGVSVDYLINDSIELSNSKTVKVIPSKHLSKLNITLIALLALTLAAVVALSIVVGVLLSKDNSPDTVEVNGFEITYLSDETYYISEENRTINLYFNVYNSTDFTKKCMQANFSIDNKSLYICWVSPAEYSIAAQEELKLRIYIETWGDQTLGALQNRSVTVKYAGKAIAKIKW